MRRGTHTTPVPRADRGAQCVIGGLDRAAAMASDHSSINPCARSRRAGRAAALKRTGRGPLRGRCLY